MNGHSFQYGRATNLQDARMQASKPGTAFLAGGTDLLQLWKSGAMTPEAVVDISRLPLGDVEFVDGQLSLGALAKLSDVAVHPRCDAISSVDRRGDSGQRQRADTQYGDGRRQSVAANPLPVFSQRAACLQ
jgi:xanthine dehydrogenase YagS FAD-binding subunit